MKAARVGIALLIVEPKAGGFVEPVFVRRPEAGTHHHPRERIAVGQIVIDVFGDGLLVGVPGERAESLPSDAEELVLRLQYGISILVPRFQELTIDLCGSAE